ncbi:MAG: hypothetical protein K6C08_07155 [Oscillospiraceae bacterium]|nr:hypothetical protein [Oscillospiraceae bacterium]
MRTNTKKKEKASKTWGIILLVIGSLFLARFLTDYVGGAETRELCIWVSLVTACAIVGVVLLKRSWNANPNSYEKWKTRNPADEEVLLRKLNRIRDDKKLLEIGKCTGLDSVASAAFAKISDQSLLGAYVLQNWGSNKRLALALSCITDNRILSNVVTARNKNFSADLREQAIDQMTDADCLLALAQESAFRETIPYKKRQEVYQRLRDMIIEQGEDPSKVDLLIACDSAMSLTEREKACARLQALGPDGDKMIARNAEIPPELRAGAYERLGDAKNAKQMHCEADQSTLFRSVNPSKDRREAAERILASKDADWVKENVRKVLNEGESSDFVLKSFLVEASTKYPGIIRQMWPQITGWAHTDATKHEDHHQDGSHTDYLSDGSSHGYRKGHHIDCQNSDCSHSDGVNSKTHTDRADANFLNQFPPAIRE